MKKWAKAKFLKHISGQETKKNVLENSLVPSNFLSRQRVDDHLPQILSETGKKNRSDTLLMKAQENLTNIMEPLDHPSTYLDHLEKDNEGVLDFNKLLELAEQCVIFVGQCHNRGSNFKRQRVLTALFKDRRKVKSLLKEGAHCFEKEQKVIFEEKFQKKLNRTIKSKKKAKELLKKYTKPTPAKRPYRYGSCHLPFRQAPLSQFTGTGASIVPKSRIVPRDGQRKFYSRGGRDKLES